MRRLSMLLGAMALMLAMPATVKVAFAHGGQYRGPAGEVPPDSRQPEDPPPPDTGGGTPTPPDGGGGTPTPPDPGGGGTPTPPPDGGQTPTPPDNSGGGVPQGPTGGPGTKTGGKMPTKRGPSYESWLFWWNYNKDEILNIKRTIRAGLASSASGGLAADTGSEGESASEFQNVTVREVETKVVPILKDFAGNSKINFDIQSAAIIGLAKIGRREMVPLMMEMAENKGDAYHKVVEESAALALGIMQDRSPQVRRFLGEIGTNPNAKYRTRCFAAFAVGLLGDREAAAGANADSYNVLKSMVTAGEASKDISCSALVGIGLLGDRVAIPDLLQWLTEEKAGAQKLNDVQLSYVAAALGKIGAPGTGGPDSRDVLDGLRQQLTRKNRMTRWSAVVAFGQIAPNASEALQKQCVSDLSQVIDSEGKATSDPQTVNFALTSLGRIAGAAGVSDATRRKAVERLVSSFDGKATTRSFASLGLGIAGPMMDKEEKADVCERIRNTLAKSSGDVEQRGAMVISLGLLKDIKSGSVLLGLLQDRGLDKALRGTAAVALGLIGDSSAVEPVRSALKEKDDQKLRVDAAIAAGLLRDTEAVQILVGILQDPKSSQFILGSVSTALGQIGDQRAVEPLAQILRDDKAQYPDLTRALACVALGQVGDKSDLSVLSRLSRDVNYRAYYEAIGEVLTIL